MEKLSNEELRVKIIDANNRQLETIYRSALYNIMISLNSANRVLNVEDDSLREGNRKYRPVLEEYIGKIEELLRENKLEEGLQLREDIYRKKNILDSYIVELSYLSQILDEHGTKILANRPEIKNARVDIDDLTMTVERALLDCKDNHSKYMFIISEIIKILPMRLVKENYYDIIRETLARNFKRLNRPTVDMYIENYKNQFDSSLREGYGLEFDYYFMEIQKIKREDFSKMDLGEMSIIVDKILRLREDLTILRDLFLTLGITSNLLIVLSKNEEVDLAIDAVVKEYFSSKEDPKALDRFDKKVREKVLSLDETLQNDLKEYEELTVEVGNRYDFDHTTIEEGLMKTRDVLTYYNDVGLIDIKYLEQIDLRAVEETYMHNSINNLIEYIDNAMHGMNNVERKIRMRTVLSMLELPFNNIHAFMSYIRYSLDKRILDQSVINFKVNQITYFLNEINEK